MTDTQPQPGRALDISMARVMGWQVYEWPEEDTWFDIVTVFPSIVADPKRVWLYKTEYETQGEIWRPSTNIAHAFEVQRDRWRWETQELLYDVWATIDTHGDGHWRHAYRGLATFREAPDRASAYALARCRAALAWWQAQAER